MAPGNHKARPLRAVLIPLHTSEYACKGLHALLDYDGDDIETVYSRDFVVERHDVHTGRVFTTELKPGGENTAVTGRNRGQPGVSSPSCRTDARCASSARPPR